MVRVDVDLNSRTWEGLVRAGMEDVQGDRQYLGVGEHVLAWQSDDDLIADAIVERVDIAKKMFYLRVKWDTLRDDAVPSNPIRAWLPATAAETRLGQRIFTLAKTWNATFTVASTTV